jgi:hypothetical protein
MHAVCCDRESDSSYAESVLRLLIDHGADLNLVVEGQGTALAALSEISSEKSLALIHFLLGQGAILEVTSGTWHVPLIAAAASASPQSYETMQLLRFAGVDLDVSGGTYDAAVLAALDPSASHSYEKLTSLFEWDASHTFENIIGTLVERAVNHPHGPVKDLVLIHLASLDHNFLQQALVVTAGTGLTEVIIQLLDFGANINGEASYNNSIATPLVAALTMNNLDTIQTIGLLVTYGAHLDVPVRGYATPLQLYLDCACPLYTVVEILLDGGLYINAPGGSNGRGSASEIAIRRYKEDTGTDGELWRMIIQLLHRHDVGYSDADFEYLIEQFWFVEFVSMAMTDMG